MNNQKNLIVITGGAGGIGQACARAFKNQPIILTDYSQEQVEKAVNKLSKEGFEVKFIENEWQYIKLLSIEEKKINGELVLEKGEIIQDNHLIKLEKPSELHSWDGVEWHLDEEKIRISKLPTKEDILNAKIELKALELLSQLELI